MPPEEYRRYQADYLAEHIADWTLAAVEGVRQRTARERRKLARQGAQP
jgi:hypothetical protein